MNNIGYDPILLEYVNIKEWLEEDTIDNFIILGNFTFKNMKVGAILLKKSYFLNVNVNDLFYVCHLSNNDDFLPKETYQLNHLNHNIGKYLKHDNSKSEFSMIKHDLLIKNLKKKKQIYEIKYPKYAFTLTFINKEALEMSQIGILNLKGSKDAFKSLQTKQGVNSFEDIYFNAKLSSALYAYSHVWDRGINPYLRQGEEFFKSDIFTKSWKKYVVGSGKNMKKEKAIENIKKKIKDIDECFLHSGERNEDSRKFFFRGMRGGYGHDAVGDKILIRNFTSVSTSPMQASKFKGGKCCFFQITVERGVPMINMENTTKFKGEREYLLPRDLIFTCSSIHRDGDGVITQYDIKVSKQAKDQFKVNSNCVKYPNCEIKVSKKNADDFTKDELNDEMKSENIIMELSEINKSKAVPDNVDTIIMRLTKKYDNLKTIEEGIDILKIKKDIKNRAKKEMKISIFADMSIKDPKKYLDFYKLYEKILDEKIKEVKKVKAPAPIPKQGKICPEGKELNEKTNRCRKIKTPKKSKVPVTDVTDVTDVTGKPVKKVCPEGKELNEKTNRCRKIKTPKKSKVPVTDVTGKPIKKVCPPGKELNEKTNRCRKIKTPKKDKVKTKINDVLDNLITINGHGSFSDQKIKVPPGFQVLIPHRNGLDNDYTTPDAAKNKLYEESLYEKGYLNYREGWKLYLPGDDVNNLGIHIFKDGASCSDIKSQHELQRELIEKCEGNHSFEKFCPLYCTKKDGNTFDYLKYKSKRKIKIKACGDYRLKDLFDNLRNSLNKIPKDHRKTISPKKDEPIVLIPFTCNAKSGSQMNHFDHNDHKKLNTIYQELVKNR